MTALPSFNDVSKLFNTPKPEDRSMNRSLFPHETRCLQYITDPVACDQLFEGGFPCAHTWISTQRVGSQLLIAKSKSATFKQDLNGLLDDDDDDDTTARERRKASNDDDDSNMSTDNLLEYSLDSLKGNLGSKIAKDAFCLLGPHEKFALQHPIFQLSMIVSQASPFLLVIISLT
jgi:hypothetical protein